MVLAGSPLLCIRRARSAFDLSIAFGRPMDWPRAPRAARAAARRFPAKFQFELSQTCEYTCSARETDEWNRLCPNTLRDAE